MQTRTFRADSLQDALDEIRRQMGSSASVLHTRQVRDGWMGWLGRTYVEVTAAEIPEGQDPTAQKSTAASTRPDQETNRLIDTRSWAQPGSDMPIADTPIADMLDEDMLVGDTLATDMTGGKQDSDLQTSDSPILNSHGTDSPIPDPHNPAAQIIAMPNETDDLDLLPAALKIYRDELLSIGVRPATVNRWISATTSFAANIDDSIPQPWLEHLQRSVARELSLGGPIRIPPGSRHVVALVGPTGVGKTTTVAKLAAGFRIESKRRVGLLTIDTFRIAAVQQLKAYADIMDLPMQVVENPNEMRPALETLGDVDIVLIDTAGRSPCSDTRIDQLADLLRSAQPDETHLVLSATSSTSAIHAVLEGFAPARPTGVILTKLDEAPQTAGILSAITATNLFAGIPVSYLTNGQQVPDDISVADAQTLLSRLLPAQVAIPRIEAA